MQPVIITNALVGNFTTRAHNPNLPISPKEIASDCLAAAKSGAAIVHIHVRDPATELPSMATALYAEVVDRIRQENDALIINLTTGLGGRFQPTDGNPVEPGPRTKLLPAEQRVEHILAIRPDIATLDLNTMVFGSEVVINAPHSVRKMAALIHEAGARPEIELFDSGDIALLHDLIKDKTLTATPLCSLVMGVKYGLQASIETLIYARSQLPKGAICTGFATGRMAFPMVALSALAGGHVRVGLEDAAYIAKGKLAPSNAAMVDKAHRILDDLGHEVATPKQARQALGL